MQAIQKKPFRTDIIYILILLVVLLWVYNRVYDKKIFLGGDNVVYYITGKALADGKGYTDISSPSNSPETWFPPGYPFISAGIMKVFGEKIEVMNKANGFFLFGSLIFLYLISVRLIKNKHLAFVICAVTAFNMHILNFSIVAMTEIPFIFTSLGSIYFLMRMKKRPLPFRDIHFWLFFSLMILSYYIRPTGIVLVCSVILYFLFQKNWKLAGIVLAGFILCASPWYLRNKAIGGVRSTSNIMQKDYYKPELGSMNTAGDWLTRIKNNSERYISLEIPGALIGFKIDDMRVYNETVPADRKWFAGILFIVLGILGIFCLKEFRWLALFYVSGTMALLVICPEEWVGVRLMLAIVPLIYLLMILAAYQGISWLLKKFDIQEKARVSLLPFFFLLYIFVLRNGIIYLEDYASIDMPYPYARYFEIAKWAKVNIPPASIVVCRKPEFFYLYSGCKAVNYIYTKDPDSLIANMKSKKATHVVLDQLGFASTNNYLYPAIKKYPEKFKTLMHMKPPDTYLFEIHYDCGYTGDMKDGKKNGKGIQKKADGSVYDGYWENDIKKGKGTFTWSNGLKFEGMFSNDLRNGPGELYIPNGQVLKCTWINDTANGYGILYNTDRTISQQGPVKNNEFVK